MREDNLVKWGKIRFGGVTVHEFVSEIVTISLLEDAF